MSLKSLHFISFILLTSCLNDDDPKRIEKWHLYSYVGSSSCFFPDDGILEEPNYIVETLLGLEDSAMIEIELHLGDNGEMRILKNNQVALSGNWKNLDQDVLSLTANGQVWNLEIVSKNEDLLVLRADGYQFIYNLEIVLNIKQ